MTKLRLIDNDVESHEIRIAHGDPIERAYLHEQFSSIYEEFIEANPGRGMESFLTFLLEELKDAGLTYRLSDGTAIDPIRDLPSARVIDQFLKLYGTPEQKNHKAKFLQFVECVVIASGRPARLFSVDKFQQWVELYRQRYVKTDQLEILEILEKGCERLSGFYCDRPMGTSNGHQRRHSPRPHLISFEKVENEPLCIVHLIWYESHSYISGNPYLSNPDVYADIPIHRCSGFAIPSLDFIDGLEFSLHLSSKTVFHHPIDLRLCANFSADSYLSLEVAERRLQMLQDENPEYSFKDALNSFVYERSTRPDWYSHGQKVYDAAKWRARARKRSLAGALPHLGSRMDYNHLNYLFMSEEKIRERVHGISHQLGLYSRNGSTDYILERKAHIVGPKPFQHFSLRSYESPFYDHVFERASGVSRYWKNLLDSFGTDV